MFVESAEISGESYLEYVLSLSEDAVEREEGKDGEQAVEIDANAKIDVDVNVDEKSDVATTKTFFSEVGYDMVDMVLIPHVAGVAIKAMDADLTLQERAQRKNQEEEDRLADMAMNVFERGNKRRKRKKKVAGGADAERAKE